MFVYLIVNSLNGKYYVGKTINSDLDHYFQSCVSDALKGNKDKPHLYNAIRKYPTAFRVYPLMSTLKTDREICEWEKFLIHLFRSRDRKIGYNIALGGQGGSPTLGRKWSEETREKMKNRIPWNRGKICPQIAAYMTGNDNGKGRKHKKYGPNPLLSASLKGRVTWNAGTKGVMTAWNKGKQGCYSKETLKNMSDSRVGKIPWNKGKSFSEESRKRMSESAKRRWAKHPIENAPAFGPGRLGESP